MADVHHTGVVVVVVTSTHNKARGMCFLVNTLPGLFQKVPPQQKFLRVSAIGRSLYRGSRRPCLSKGLGISVSRILLAEEKRIPWYAEPSPTPASSLHPEGFYKVVFRS
jgi:hypothetical protein